MNFLKILFLLLIYIGSINCKVVFAQKGDSDKPKAKASTEKKKNNSSNNSLTEEDLKYELSGKYEGILEIPLCCDSYDYKYGNAYIDVTKSPITFIYSGVIYDSTDYYYEDKKILAKNFAYSGNPLVGWFEKINGNWVFWQRFDGDEEDVLSIKKPEFITKRSDLDDSKSEIQFYYNQQTEFEAFWEKFRNALINSDYNTLSDFIDLPLKDESYLTNENKLPTEINSGIEFYQRMQIFLNNFESTPTPNEYILDKKCYKEMENNDFNGAKYIFYGIFNLVFDKINGEYKLVMLGAWG